MSSLPYPSRRLIALVVAVAALFVVFTVAIGAVGGMTSVGAVPAQRRTTTTDDVTPTTDDTPTTRQTSTTQKRTTSTARSTSTRARSTTTARATTRSTASTRATSTTRGSTTTTIPAVTSSTETPALLVAGPDGGAEGEAAVAAADDRVSTDTKLKMVIGGLIAVALAIGGLTYAYWRHTKPSAGFDGDGGARRVDPSQGAGGANGASGAGGASGPATERVPVTRPASGAGPPPRWGTPQYDR